MEQKKYLVYCCLQNAASHSYGENIYKLFLTSLIRIPIKSRGSGSLYNSRDPDPYKIAWIWIPIK